MVLEVLLPTNNILPYLRKNNQLVQYQGIITKF